MSTTEAEWEYAARAASEDSRFWGDDDKQACAYANGMDQIFLRSGYGGKLLNCEDGYVYTAEVGSFESNGFGLHDIIGNVHEWVRDNWHDNYQDSPADSSMWEEGGATRVHRGGSWFSRSPELRSAAREYNNQLFGNITVGFRLAKTLNL